MEFIHRPYISGETIAAISTPPGEGGIAIIRISGKEAIAIADKAFSGPVKNYKSHTAHFGYVKDAKGKKVDEALVLVMLGKRSYTGEDTVEIQCHGGAIASRQVLETVIQAGARAANPGEFTFRAFINGKLDLAQAEAVQYLISAKNEKSFEAAHQHLEGKLSSKILAFQARLVDVAAIIEAWIDFPEEGLEFATMEQMCDMILQIIMDMKRLLLTFEDGKKLQHGISLCIVGAPNSGKSSLMNALLEKERAIVTPIAGTTRDVLEEDLCFNGLHLRLIDTAGIRQAEEIIEKEGIRRTHQAIQKADLILFVLDSSRCLNDEELALCRQLPKEKTMLIWNKIDMPQILDDEIFFLQLGFLPAVKISAKESMGLDELKAAIDGLIWQKGSFHKEEVFITSIRHKEALAQAILSTEIVLEALQKEVSPEFIMIDIRQALSNLGRIIGANVSEDILSAIFSKFCIGK